MYLIDDDISDVPRDDKRVHWGVSDTSPNQVWLEDVQDMMFMGVTDHCQPIQVSYTTLVIRYVTPNRAASPKLTLL